MHKQLEKAFGLLPSGWSNTLESNAIIVNNYPHCRLHVRSRDVHP